MSSNALKSSCGLHSVDQWWMSIASEENTFFPSSSSLPSPPPPVHKMQTPYGQEREISA